jgi:dienelactone hydrolase
LGSQSRQTVSVTDDNAATPSASHADPADAPWKARFRAARMTLPGWAIDRPDRALYASNASGTVELYTWDRATGATRQVTDRASGTYVGVLDPAAESVWWFDDTAGDEFGVWRCEPFDGGRPAQVAVDGLEPSYPAGLALGADGTAVVGRSTDGGSSIHLARPNRLPTLIYAHPEDARVAALSRDGSLLAIGHSEHGDSRHRALRVLELGIEGAASTVAQMWDGDGLGLDAVGFAPTPGDNRLLVLHERRGRWLPLIWDLGDGSQLDLAPAVAAVLPGDVSAQWYHDGSALLIGHEYQARSELYRLDLDTSALTKLPTPRGMIAGATARPDGTVEFLWSSGAQPPAVRNIAGELVFQAPGAAAPASVPVDDAWVEGPAGTIHALVSKPAGLSGPLPTVFLVHGGPTAQDADSFSPGVAAWVDAGFAVVRVNYRGSTGYGSAWRDAIEHRVGLTELDDIAAVRDWAVACGLAEPASIVLAGASWGGYLTLLGLGVLPQAWSIGIAGVPVADYVAAYEDEMEALRAFDRSLFGGTPDDMPDSYRRSSPISYVDQVRAPVLVLAGANDPRCPIRQIENYLERLSARSAPHEVYRFDAGHGSLVVEERIKQVAVELDFARRHLPARF